MAGKVAESLDAAGAQVDAPGLGLFGLLVREGAAGEQCEIGAGSGIAHRSVAQDCDVCRPRSFGQVLASLIAVMLFPKSLVTVERWAREVETVRRGVAHRESRVLAGVGGPRRIRRLGEEEQAMKRQLSGRSLDALGGVVDAVGETGAPEAGAEGVGRAIAKRGREQVVQVLAVLGNRRLGRFDQILQQRLLRQVVD